MQGKPGTEAGGAGERGGRSRGQRQGSAEGSCAREPECISTPHVPWAPSEMLRTLDLPGKNLLLHVPLDVWDGRHSGSRPTPRALRTLSEPPQDEFGSKPSPHAEGGASGRVAAHSGPLVACRGGGFSSHRAPAADVQLLPRACGWPEQEGRGRGVWVVRAAADSRCPWRGRASGLGGSDRAVGEAGGSGAPSGCPSRTPALSVAGGALLVIESLLDADGRGPLTTQLYSLNMLVQTEGQERTPGQYRELLAAAGFTDVECRRTGRPYDAVLARK